MGYRGPPDAVETMRDSAAMKNAALNTIFVRTLALGGGGLRVGVKDSLDIAGYPTQAASATLQDAPPASRHAVVVQSLLDGGCRIVGKTNMHELAYGVTGVNRFTGTPPNPRYPDRVPGRSSSGSAAAVAAGLVDFAIGTDTGGSIRIPAACCGVYGLKPTYGRVSRVGAHPAVSSLDCIGPFAGDPSLLERAMALIDPTFTIQPPPAEARVGLVHVDADPAIAAAVERALSRSRLTVVARQLPSLGAAYTAALHLVAAETLAGFGHLLESQAMGADVLALPTLPLGESTQLAHLCQRGIQSSLHHRGHCRCGRGYVQLRPGCIGVAAGDCLLGGLCGRCFFHILGEHDSGI
jgi:amidase